MRTAPTDHDGWWSVMLFAGHQIHHHCLRLRWSSSSRRNCFAPTWVASRGAVRLLDHSSSDSSFFSFSYQPFSACCLMGLHLAIRIALLWAIWTAIMLLCVAAIARLTGSSRVVGCPWKAMATASTNPPHLSSRSGRLVVHASWQNWKKERNIPKNQSTIFTSFQRLGVRCY